MPSLSNPVGPEGAKFGDLVNQARRTAGMSKAELARRMGERGRPMTLHVLTKLEAKARHVDIDDFLALTAVLNIPITSLVGACATCDSRHLSGAGEQEYPRFEVQDPRGAGIEPIRDSRWLAEFCGVGLRTVGRWQAEGTGPEFTRIGPRSARYREADVERWLQERRSTTNQSVSPATPAPPVPVPTADEIAQLCELQPEASRLRGSLPADHPYRIASERLTALLDELTKRGVPIRALADITGVTYHAVRARLVNHGYLPRMPSQKQYLGAPGQAGGEKSVA